ncbi:hypothetical protein KC333_g6493 [Hortaea werneckii]|nr:hypothetical protein KC333_g6493 [Hortaea werneckii]KAI7310592.1 hypothetical protein KC326_g6624 [Hortaea werneckii]
MNLSQSTDLPTPSQLVLENSNDSVLKLIMALRGLDISAESTFDFVLPEGCKEWPAPHYGPYSPHTERPKTGGSLRLRKREATGLVRLGGKKAAKVQRQKQGGFPRMRVGTHGKGDLYTTTSTSSGVGDPSLLSAPQIPIPTNQSHNAAPLTILSLPRELRDLIYTHLVQHPEPLIPQYRPCWKPTLPGPTTTTTTATTKRRRSHHRVIRRLPPDPPLAFVSRQLRHETLSAFYGTNTFVFERAAEPLLGQDFNMLDPAWMRRWMRGCSVPPSSSSSDGEDGGDGGGSGDVGGDGGVGRLTYLKTIHLRFNDIRRTTETGPPMTGTVTYRLSQPAGSCGAISVQHDLLSTGFSGSCACAEDALVDWISARSREGKVGFVGLGHVALQVCRWRGRDLGVDGKGKGGRVRLGGQARRAGGGERCGVCGKIGVSRGG